VKPAWWSFLPPSSAEEEAVRQVTFLAEEREDVSDYFKQNIKLRN